MLGWDTGTLEVMGPIRLEPTPEFKASYGGFKTKKLEICTSDESEKLSSSTARVDDQDGAVTWELGGSASADADNDHGSEQSKNNKVRLPVYNRYASAALFQIGSGGIGPVGQDADYIAVCWFKDVPDDEERTVRIPVLKSANFKQLRQNYSACFFLLLWSERVSG
jgi:hypothetical protein